MLIDALANDTDADGDTLTLIMVQVKSGSGVASIKDNQILFEPDGVGTTLLDYAISDGNGGEAQAVVTVMVNGAAEIYVGSSQCVSCHVDKKPF